MIELMEPNKTDVLNYLDHGGPTPARYAHVIIDHRADIETYYQDLLVSLPIQNGTTKAEFLTYPYTRKTQGRVRNLNASLDADWSSWMYNVTASILDVTLDLWNGSALGLDNDTLDVWGIDPLMQGDGVTRWDTFWNLPATDMDSGTLLPLGLFFKSNITGRDSSKWTLDGWLYNDIYYPTTDAFRAVYYSPGFEKFQANIDGS
jgi:primary-amine oxidase